VVTKLAHEQLDLEAFQHRLPPTRREQQQDVGSSVRLAVSEPRRLTPVMMLHLQRSVGNRAIAGLLSGPARPAPPTPVQRRCQCGGTCEDCGGDETRMAPEVPHIDAAAQRIPHSGDLVIQRWQWPWEEEEGGAGGAPPQREPTGSEGGAEGTGPGSSDTEAWGGGGSSDSYDTGEDYGQGGAEGSGPGTDPGAWVGGGGESGGGGSSDSWDDDVEATGGWECTVDCYLERIDENHECTHESTGAASGYGSNMGDACKAAKTAAAAQNPDPNNCKVKHCDKCKEGVNCKKVHRRK